MKQLFLYIALFFPFLLNAQDKVPGIIVYLSSGEVIEFKLSEHPQMEFNGNTIKVKTDKVEVNYSLSEFDKVKTGDVNSTSGIQVTDYGQSRIEKNSDFVRLISFESNKEVRVYSSSGQLYSVYHTDKNGSLIIPMTVLPMGISIISINKLSIKILRK